MERAADVLGYVNTFMFTGLALLAIRSWWKDRGAGAAWVALTFGTLATATVAGLIVPEEPGNASEEFASKALIAVLLLFPYCLFRFTGAFERSKPLWEAAAAAATFSLIAWTMLLPELPGPNDERPSWFGFYILGVLGIWTALSVAAAWKLWQAGRGEPNLVRQRMRFLSLASLGLNLALIVVGTAPEGSPRFAVFGQVLALGSVLFFYLGFAPPPMLRYAWRRHEQEELQRAVVALMTATEESEVAQALLPHVAAIFGGKSAALINQDGDLIGHHGMNPELQEQLDNALSGERIEQQGAGYVRVEMPFGAMFVWVSPYTPFFGKEDIELLESLGVLADLRLERCRSIKLEKEARETLERINAELADAQALAQLGSWEWIVDSDTINWSDELYRIFGITKENMAAGYEAYIELVHPEDRDHLNQIVNRASRTGEPYEVEHRIVRGDGAIRWVRSRGRSQKDPSGKVARLLGTAQDITESRLAEEYERELREAETRQKQALELNDNIVQGLAVAGMALELGEEAKAKDAIARTMSAAQAIISGLLRSSGKDGNVQPGDLIRSRSARLDHPDQN